MAYSNNPNLPTVRMEAVRLVQSGWSARKTARYLGFAHNTVLNWLKRKPEYGAHGRLIIPTRSCRPSSHPRQLSSEVVSRILELRRERDQCAEILHHRLGQEGVVVSLSSVKRVLSRRHISRYSKWKKWHQYPPRPLPHSPGVLIQIDSMREGLPSEHLYAYALIDVCSRWAFAGAVYRANSRESTRFITAAQTVSPFSFKTIQSDHGSEFSKWFTKVVEHKDRHSRVRTPTDNSYVERFIRTLQEECLNRTSRKLVSWRKAIPEYLEYYNKERPHMGLNMQTPMQVVRSY